MVEVLRGGRRNDVAPEIRGREHEISPLLSQFPEWVARSRAHSGEALLDAWIGRDLLRAQVLGQMRKYPILLCPVASMPAFRHGERSWTIDGTTVDYLDAWSYTEWFNLLGDPARWFGWPIRRRPAHRHANRRPSVGGRVGAGRRGCAGGAMRTLAETAID